jgi:type III pantothenate kinase
MNLIVDVGNTSAKVAIFNQQQLIEKRTFMDTDLLKNYLSAATIENCLISSVRIKADEISNWISPANQKFILSHTLPLPIKILYDTPHTLGVDRIAGSCGASSMFPKMNSLVIDAGTCITYDFTNAQGEYLGGGISPGLEMRFKALNTFTSRLPLVKANETPELVGTSTEASIQSGVINGIASEMEGLILRYQEKYPELNVILCGGDTSFFENRLKATIFAAPELVLFGLNSVLIHNVRI